MAIKPDVYQEVLATLPASVTLVAVSKTKPVPDIRVLYDLGQRDFGENYVQELLEKQPQLPEDTRWHFIGHLQSNKVKYIAPFVHMIQGVDTYSLLREINKRAGKAGRSIDCLLQVHIAREETKFGFDADELKAVLQEYTERRPGLTHIRLRGLMGMASNTNDHILVREEFAGLKHLFDKFHPRLPEWDTLSMGMSIDYSIAVEEGSTMVRIGSLLFGTRG
jgi:pyridoxal phosphate enzyme (YggS family)